PKRGWAVGARDDRWRPGTPISLLQGPQELEQIARLLRRGVAENALRHQACLQRLRAVDFPDRDTRLLVADDAQHYLLRRFLDEESGVDFAPSRFDDVRQILRFDRLRRHEQAFDNLGL